MTTVFRLAFLTCLVLGFDGTQASSPDPFITTLFKKISSQQVTEDQPYRVLRSWYKQQGVYSSDIMVNFHGNLLMAEVRRRFRVFDNNMFVTSLVTSSLLEAFKYGRAPRPTDKQLMLTLNALRDYQDKNVKYNTSVMTFWQQQFNVTTNYWRCWPVNLHGAFDLLDLLPVGLVEMMLKLMDLGEIAKMIEMLTEQKDTVQSAFRIPPDFDDTFLNLALGTLLYEQKDEFPIPWEMWDNHNANITSVFDALKKYAYRPFSKDTDLSSIDPRTYFHIRGFLDQAKKNGQDVALIPTWIQSINDMRKEYDLGVGMPFSVNNVDVTVAANTVFAITSGVITGLVAPAVLEDAVISQVYENTSSLIAYEIKNNFSGRPDLALTYYPSRIEFYWFVARTLAVLETSRRNGTLPLKVMERVYAIFKDVTENHMTTDILQRAAVEGANMIYFDDFLGDGDITFDAKPLKRGEDRIFTTSMAVNALTSAWTYFDRNLRKSFWKKGTPAAVKWTVAGCVRWLRQHTFDGKYDPWNAFFSGSGKSFETMPFWYPGNRLEYLNGTQIFDWSNIPNSTFVYAVQGYIPADVYDAMLKEKHFGQLTPLTFAGYNNGSSFFPLWTSVPYTYSTVLLAVSRFGRTNFSFVCRSLEECRKHPRQQEVLLTI